jgi:hypothetical protein
MSSVTPRVGRAPTTETVDEILDNLHALASGHGR